jgi:O-antigen/teichoic acid export membrane protein
VLLLSLALHSAATAGMLPQDSAYAHKELPAVLAVASFSAVIHSFQSTRMATGFRTFEHKRIAQMELLSQVAGLAVMIAIALASRSVWALVAGTLAGALARTVLSHTWLRGHANRFRFEREAFREVIGFGKWIFVSSAVFVLAAHGDRLLLGGFVDAQLLGLYAIAVLLIGALESGMHNLFITVSLPALSEIARNDPARMREVYGKMRLPADIALLFLSGLLFAAGQLVIDVLYDSRYAEAGGMLQILALSLFMTRYTLAQQVYLAVGMPRYQAIINVARMVALYGLVAPLLYYGGVQAALWAIALHGLATLPFIYRFNARLGLNDWRLELRVLGALPVGYLCGALLARVLG